MRNAYVVEMLLSRTCDAVVFLGPRLEVVKGAEQLSSLLMRSGDPQRFANRALTEVIVEADQTNVVDALTAAHAIDDDDTEPGRRAGVVSARLRDAAGIPVPVQIFHACLGSGDEGVRVAGIKEDQDQDVDHERGSARFRSGFVGSEEARSDPEAASSDSSGSSDADADASPGMEERERQARTAAALEFDSQTHVSFDVVDADASGNSYPITSSSPSFTLLFGNGSQPGRLTSMLSFFSKREQHKFDDWVLRWPEYHDTGLAASRWVSFEMASLNRIGVRLAAHCSLAPCDLHEQSMRLRLHELYWQAARHQPRLPPTERRLRPEKRRSRRSASSSSPGTPPLSRASSLGRIKL
jgi:hypothetical protein